MYMHNGQRIQTLLRTLRPEVRLQSSKQGYLELRDAKPRDQRLFFSVNSRATCYGQRNLFVGQR